LAASPIKRSVSVKATYEGVVRLPWSLAMISTRSFCQTPTHEYVVPRSIPTDSPVTAIDWEEITNVSQRSFVDGENKGEYTAKEEKLHSILIFERIDYHETPSLIVQLHQDLPDIVLLCFLTYSTNPNLEIL
jgi:hypothetical protein